MNEATNRGYKFGRRAMLTIGLCSLAAAGATSVVAAGGVEAIRSWFATAEVIQPDGTKTELEVTADGVIEFGDGTGVMISSPDQLEGLQGQTIKIFRAPSDHVKASGLTAEEERAQLRKQAEAAEQSDE